MATDKSNEARIRELKAQLDRDPFNINLRLMFASALEAGVLPKKMHRQGPSGQYAISPTATSAVGVAFFIWMGTSK